MVYESLYSSPTGLKTVGFVVAAYLLVAHSLGLAKPEAAKNALKSFPRSRNMGIGLLVVAAVWCYGLFAGLNLGIVEIPVMSLGEFNGMRGMLTWAVPIGAVLVGVYATEFLSVRALGCLVLLAAAVVLDAAFQKEPTSRLLLVVLAYAGIFKALFWIGKPYLFRDSVKWVTADDKRWKLAMGAGLGYGVLVLVASLLWY
ncbi:hypothetical protein [Sulfuriroseicoccus oceanibius]|uniref:Uncharacterized protein n=1 Tax=Sulfuriroseicoccus oceanibius TaxID=2707525 RepID=A0A6B3LD74_9BACT|nr:hypothetical protein [Sulfuriroseicoccus oceanibius]QQL45082.1 hypothetical protein G3M56_000395 [Sulfuriroseicoccus oceanibius]